MADVMQSLAGSSTQLPFFYYHGGANFRHHKNNDILSAALTLWVYSLSVMLSRPSLTRTP